MFNLQNPIQLGQVDEGKFNFPASSLLKGEGVGELNFPSFFSDFEFILGEIWDLTLQRNQNFILIRGSSFWVSSIYVDYFFGQFKGYVEEELMKLGFNSWVPELYSKFCRYVRMRKLERLKGGYASSLLHPRRTYDFSIPNLEQTFSKEVLPKVWGKAYEFQKSLTLAKIDKIDNLVSRKFLDSFNLDYRESRHFKYDISKSAFEIDFKAFAKALEIEKVDKGSFNFPISSLTKLEGVGKLKFPESFPSVQEKAFSPTISYVLKEKAEEIVFYRNLMEFLFFFYEFDIGKSISFLSHLEDLQLCDI